MAMWRILIILAFAAAGAVGPLRSAAAQSSMSPKSDADAKPCTLLVTFFEKYGVPPEAQPLTLDRARAYQRDDNQQFCRSALGNFAAANIYPPVDWHLPGDIKGKSLYGANGRNEIGSIAAIVTSGTSRTPYLIVAHGGFFGFGVTRTPVPAAKVIDNGGQLRLRGMTEQEFAATPALDPTKMSYKDFTPPVRPARQ
jgi:hypothetical protein